MIRILRFVAVSAIAFILLSVPFYISSAGTNTNTVSVIVEFKGDPAAIYAAKAKQGGAALSDDQIRAYRSQLTTTQNQFLDALRSKGINFELQTINVKDTNGNVAGSVPLRYTLVYNGVTLTVPEAAVSTIQAMPQVKKVHSNGVLHPDLVKSVDYIRATKVYGKNPNDFTQFAINPDGDEGQGIYIAVIDTGIDWTHPMFGGDPTPPRLGVAPVSASVPTNQKVVYSLPLADIVTDGFGHGTHVASEAAGYLANAPGPDGVPGTADDIPIHGVAPQAKLMSYKVCSDTLSTVSEVVAVGGCFSSNIIMALEDAVSPQTVDLQPKPVANVINMSLGGAGGPDEPTTVAADNATLMGASVVAAAGNSGPGEGTVGSPGAGRRVISPAANSDPASHANWSAEVLAPNSFSQSRTGAVTPANTFSTQQGFARLKLYPQAGTPAPPDSSFAQYYALVDNPLVAWPSSVSGRIALIKDSGVVSATFFDICTQAVNAGAVGVLLDSTTTNPTAVRCSIPAANIMPEDAQVLINGMTSDGSAPANGALSQFPVRMNPDFDIPFVGDTAIFSSRGPVQGYGQVKPDVSAPGVNILGAVPPASAISVLFGFSNGVNYAAISGTSMATPHTSGAVALIRQAHPDWTPDVIRTVLINTATNMRDLNRTPKADGLTANSVNEQGGGLIDVAHAVNAKAIMGVAGDGIAKPSILGSHSFGEVHVANNRSTTTQSVTVTIQDISGQGGTYNLAVANNRDLQQNGISVAVSQTAVTVPAGGITSFNVNVTFDGNTIRDPNVADAIVSGNTVSYVTRPLELQWYVTAQRTDGSESLRMPFYYKPATSVPSSANIASKTTPYTGTILAGDNDLQTSAGVTYQDYPVQADATTINLSADLDFFQVVNGTFADLDLFLLDPDGNVVAKSTAPGGPEHVSYSVARSGTYTWRVAGSLNAATDFTLTTVKTSTTAIPPALQQVAGDYVDASGNHIDFDGQFNLQWQPSGGEQGFEVEQSTDNQNWQVIADVSGNTNSLAVSNLADGKTYYFRVRAIYPGQIGLYVTPPSNVTSVLINQRTLADITSQVKTAVSNVSLAGGVFQLDLNMTNQSGNTYLPLVSLNVVGVHSTSNTVRVANADNGGDGLSTSTAALFDYSHQLGDEIFSPGETTGNRTLKFQDSASEMFTFDVDITAYQGTSGSASSSSSASAQTGASGAGGGLTSTLSQINTVMRFTVNPLTKSVTAQLVSLKL